MKDEALYIRTRCDDTWYQPCLDCQTKYSIFYSDREFAHAQGDPCLGSVYAGSKEEAENKARKRNMSKVPGVGVWAVPAQSK